MPTRAVLEAGGHGVRPPYNGHIAGANLRYDFDPIGHPEAPSHRHPFGEDDVRRPCDQVAPATVVTELLAIIAREATSGRLAADRQPAS